jgi:RNA polymerase sigma factor (sigma-70 family)
LPLAKALSRRVGAIWPRERDDIRATAYLALVEASRTFDPARGVSFSTFARHRIRFALREFQRLLYSAGWRGSKADQRILQSLGEFHHEKVRVIGVTGEPPVGRDIEESEAIEAWLSRLPSRLAMACRLIYVYGNSQTEAAQAVGCSRSLFSRLHDEALARLSSEPEVTEEDDAGPYAPGEFDDELAD